MRKLEKNKLYAAYVFREGKPGVTLTPRRKMNRLQRRGQTLSLSEVREIWPDCPLLEEVPRLLRKIIEGLK